MNKKYHSLIAAASIAALSFGLAACGDDDDTPTDTTVAAAATAAPAATGAPAAATQAEAATTEAATDEPAAATAAASGESSEFGAMLADQLETMGITVTDEQATCLADNAADLDPNDANASMAIFETCGIDLAAAAGG